MREKRKRKDWTPDQAYRLYVTIEALLAQFERENRSHPVNPAIVEGK